MRCGRFLFFRNLVREASCVFGIFFPPGVLKEIGAYCGVPCWLIPLFFEYASIGLLGVESVFPMQGGREGHCLISDR